MRRQNVNGAAAIDFVAEHIGIEPCPLSDGCDAWQNARRDFCRNEHLSILVKDPHGVAVLNAARLRINRVDPDLLRTRLLQDVDIAVAGVGTRFIVEAG